MGWAKGWPNCDTTLLVPLTVNGTGFPSGVDSRLHRLFTLLLQETEKRGYALHGGWCWGYGCRAISGTNKPSEHSRGKAVDVNAPRNTRGTKGDIPKAVYTLFEAYGFVWGGRWGWTDPMHLEYAGTPRSARRRTRRAERELTYRKAYRIDDKVFGSLTHAMSYLRGKLRRGDLKDDFHIEVVKRRER